MWAAIAVFLLLSNARHAAFISLNGRINGRPLRASQTSRAASSSVDGTNRSKSAPTLSSSALEVWFDLTIGSSDTRRYTRHDATSSAAIQRGCLPILVFALLVAFAPGVGGGKIVDSGQMDYEYGL
jgi:hypothetical protein